MRSARTEPRKQRAKGGEFPLVSRLMLRETRDSRELVGWKSGLKICIDSCWWLTVLDDVAYWRRTEDDMYE
jgi:hypothetical protein